jgi:hypothetical protein
MSDIPDYPVYSKNVLEFITVAHDYCLTLGKPEKLKIKMLNDYLRKVLPLLYIKADLLPSVDISNENANERYITEEDWQALFNHLRRIFGKNDEFWYIDQSGKTNDMSRGSVSEHLTDIYQDLKDFVVLYQKNSLDAKENAVASIKRLFFDHWGFKVINVMPVLHYLNLESADIDDIDLPKYF